MELNVNPLNRLVNQLWRDIERLRDAVLLLLFEDPLDNPQLAIGKSKLGADLKPRFSGKMRRPEIWASGLRGRLHQRIMQPGGQRWSHRISDSFPIHLHLLQLIGHSADEKIGD